MKKHQNFFTTSLWPNHSYVICTMYIECTRCGGNAYWNKVVEYEQEGSYSQLWYQVQVDSFNSKWHEDAYISLGGSTCVSLSISLIALFLSYELVCLSTTHTDLLFWSNQIVHSVLLFNLRLQSFELHYEGATQQRIWSK